MHGAYVVILLCEHGNIDEKKYQRAAKKGGGKKDKEKEKKRKTTTTKKNKMASHSNVFPVSYHITKPNSNSALDWGNISAACLLTFTTTMQRHVNDVKPLSTYYFKLHC